MNGRQKKLNNAVIGTLEAKNFQSENPVYNEAHIAENSKLYQAAATASMESYALSQIMPGPVYRLLNHTNEDKEFGEVLRKFMDVYCLDIIVNRYSAFGNTVE